MTGNESTGQKKDKQMLKLIKWVVVAALVYFLYWFFTL